jgi:aspartate kinase
MGIIVSKFGGSSTANASNLKRVANLVRSAPSRRCVVLSAPGIDGKHREKVTAMLDRCWDNRKHTAAFNGAVSAVAERYREICAGLGVPDMSPLVRRTLYRAAAISLPHLLSRGEYLIALLFSRYTGLPAVDAASLIAFDATGTVDEDQTRRSLRRIADSDRAVIVPGFYGADAEGRVHILPRNGSDISGAIIAAGMDADLFENWTDVPGLMTADPAIVPEARLIPHVGYRQMRALSRAGAQVLHPACLDPVAMAGIPTRLRCTMHPESFGTLIDERCDRVAPCVVGRRSAPLPSRPEIKASCISVFGVPEAKARAAAESLGALEVRRDGDAARIYVEAPEYEDRLRRLHGALIL